MDVNSLIEVKVPPESKIETLDKQEIPVKHRAISSCILLGLLLLIGVCAGCVGYYGISPEGNGNDMCLNNCTVIAGGDSFERQSAVIYENLIEIKNAEEIPVENPQIVEDETDQNEPEYGLTYHCMTTLYGSVISIGGKYTENKIFKMQSRSWREYSDVDQMKQGRYEHGCGYSTASNATYVCGGLSSETEEVKECEVLTSSGQWEQSGILSVSRSARPIVLEIETPAGPRIMVAGGKAPDGNILSSVEIMELNGDFREGPSLPVGLAMAAGMSFEGSTYIFGGETENGLSAVVYELKYETDEWIEYGQMDKPRSAHAVSYLSHSHGIIVGGQHHGGELVRSEIYDWSTGLVAISESSGPARPGISAVQMASEVYL